MLATLRATHAHGRAFAAPRRQSSGGKVLAVRFKPEGKGRVAGTTSMCSVACGLEGASGALCALGTGLSQRRDAAAPAPPADRDSQGGPIIVYTGNDPVHGGICPYSVGGWREPWLPGMALLAWFVVGRNLSPRSPPNPLASPSPNFALLAPAASRADRPPGEATAVQGRQGKSHTPRGRRVGTAHGCGCRPRSAAAASLSGCAPKAQAPQKHLPPAHAQVDLSRKTPDFIDLYHSIFPDTGDRVSPGGGGGGGAGGPPAGAGRRPGRRSWQTPARFTPPPSPPVPFARRRPVARCPGARAPVGGRPSPAGGVGRDRGVP